MILLVAINRKNHSLVNKAVQSMVKYIEYNDMRDVVADNSELGEDDKLYKYYDKQCIKFFDSYLERMDELPKGQRLAIDKFIISRFG